MTQSEDSNVALVIDAITEVIDEARSRHRVLATLLYDHHHSQQGFKLRFAFDFNVLRPHLFPLLDGAYGSSRFFPALLAHSFFFEHGFDLLMLPPYMQELAETVRKYRVLFSTISDDSSEAVLQGLEGELPFVRQRLITAGKDLSDPHIRRSLSVQLVDAVNNGWHRFIEMKASNRLLTLDMLCTDTTMDPSYSESSDYRKIEGLIGEVKLTRTRLDRAPDVVRGRIRRDAEAVHVVTQVNKRSYQEGTGEILVLATADDSLKSLMNSYPESFLNWRVELPDGIDTPLEKSISKVTCCREFEYFAMFLFLYSPDPNQFSTQIREPLEMIDDFLGLVEQFEIAILQSKFHGSSFPHKTADDVMDAYEKVKAHLDQFNTSTLVESAALFDAPGILQAVDDLRECEKASEIDFETIIDQFVSRQGELSDWFVRSLSDVELVMREIEIGLAESGLLFDRKKLAFYYPTRLAASTDRDFIKRSRKALSYLAELEPRSTAEAIRIVHRLIDEYPNSIDAKILLARSYAVQGLSELGYRLTKALLGDEPEQALPELLFTHARLAKKNIDARPSQREDLIMEAMNCCSSALKRENDRDPRVLRELAYLTWMTALDREELGKSDAVIYSPEDVTFPQIPLSSNEFAEVTRALEYMTEALEILTGESDLGYDRAPLTCIVLNDIAYLRYSLSLGRIVTGDLEPEGLVGLYETITDTAKSESRRSLERAKALTEKQRRTLPLSSLFETFVRILLAEYDIGRQISGSSRPADNRLEGVLKLAAAITAQCNVADPSDQCNSKLALEVTRRTASSSRQSFPNEYDDILGMIGEPS